MTIHVGVDGILGGRVPGGEGSNKFFPVCGRVHFKERIVNGVVEGPAQGQLSGFTGYEFADGWPVAGDHDLNGNVRFPLDVNHFLPVLRIAPAVGREVLAAVVEMLNVDILDRGTDVGETPGNALIMAHYHKRRAWQGDPDDIELA